MTLTIKSMLLVLSRFLIASAFRFDNGSYQIQLAQPSGLINSIDISEDGQTLVAISSDYKIYVYTFNHQTLNEYQLNQVITDSDKFLECIDISDDSKYIVAGGWENCTFLYQKNQDKYQMKQKLCGNSIIMSIKILEENQAFVVARQTEIELIKLEVNKFESVYTVPVDGHILAMDCSADGKYLVVGGDNMPVAVYQMNENTYSLFLTLTGETTRSISISEDGETLVFIDLLRCIQVYSRQNDTYMHTQSICTESSEPSKCFIKEQYIFAGSNIGGSLHVYKHNTAKQEYELDSQISKPSFTQGISALTTNKQFSHFAIGVAEADGFSQPNQPKIVVLTDKKFVSQQVLDALLIAVIVMSALLFVLFIGFCMYRKIMQRKKNYSIQSLNSNTDIKNMTETVPNGMMTDTITNDVITQTEEMRA